MESPPDQRAHQPQGPGRQLLRGPTGAASGPDVSLGPHRLGTLLTPDGQDDQMVIPARASIPSLQWYGSWCTTHLLCQTPLGESAPSKLHITNICNVVTTAPAPVFPNPNGPTTPAQVPTGTTYVGTAPAPYTGAVTPLVSISAGTPTQPHSFPYLS